MTLVAFVTTKLVVKFAVAKNEKLFCQVAQLILLLQNCLLFSAVAKVVIAKYTFAAANTDFQLLKCIFSNKILQLKLSPMQLWQQQPVI